MAQKIALWLQNWLLEGLQKDIDRTMDDNTPRLYEHDKLSMHGYSVAEGIIKETVWREGEGSLAYARRMEKALEDAKARFKQNHDYEDEYSFGAGSIGSSEQRAYMACKWIQELIDENKLPRED